MTIQQQYNSLDTSKLPKEVLFEVNEIKEDTENFTNIPDFIREDWKMLWNEVIMKKYKEAVNTNEQKKTISRPKPKKTATSPKKAKFKKGFHFSDGGNFKIINEPEFDKAEGQWNYHIQNTQRKTTFWLYEDKLIKALANPKKVSKKETTTRKKEAQKKRRKTTATNSKSKTTSIDIEKVAHYSQEYTLIRRFWNTIHKPITFRKAQLLFWAFEKAIVARKVRKTSSKADLFNRVNVKVVKLFKLMEADEIKVIKNLTIEDNKLNRDVEKLVKGLKVDDAVRLLNRFIGLQGKDITKVQATRLYNSIEKATKSNRVTKSNRLYGELTKAKKELKIFLDTGKEPIEPTTQTLSGTGNLSKSKKKIIVESSEPVHAPIVDNGLFTQATQKEKQKVPGTFRLKGEIGKFMQDLQRYRLAIALTGDPHAGKSEFVKQLVNAFINEGLKCGFFDLEQGGLYSKDTRASIDRNITKANQQKLYVCGEAPDGVHTIKQFANSFDVVVIDSWQKLNIRNTRFDELRQEFPNTIFIVIFQQNGTGGTRGGVTVDYDTPIAIKVHKVDDTFVNNYAELIKNRGNEIGLRYNIVSKQIQNNQEN